MAEYNAMKTSAKSIDNANKALFFLLFSLFKFFEAVEQQTIPIRTKANNRVFIFNFSSKYPLIKMLHHRDCFVNK